MFQPNVWKLWVHLLGVCHSCAPLYFAGSSQALPAPSINRSCTPGPVMVICFVLAQPSCCTQPPGYRVYNPIRPSARLSPLWGTGLLCKYFFILFGAWGIILSPYYYNNTFFRVCQPPPHLKSSAGPRLVNRWFTVATSHTSARFGKDANGDIYS